MSDDLDARLERMSTEDLVAMLAARDEREWRPEVFPLAERILVARGVDVAALPRPEPEFHPEGTLASVTTFHTGVEANLCRMALHEAGIEAWISTEALAGVAPPLGIAVGVDVLVRADDVQAARELIAKLDAGAAELPEEPETCPKCGSQESARHHVPDAFGAVSGYVLMATPLPSGSWRWRCEGCGHEWV